MTDKYDIAVIGGGPGGYIAAIRAAQLGFNTVVIEKAALGGICLNWGCIPTKALLRSAEIYNIINHAEEFGVECKEIKINFKKIIGRSREVAKKLSDGIKHLMKKNNITVIAGHAKLAGKMQIQLTKPNKEIELINSKNIIIATGARARVLANIEPDNDLIWDYKAALSPETLPKSILVIGSGAIGIEFASFYNMLGSKIVVIEMLGSILNTEDDEIAALAHKEFEKHGIEILTNTTVKKIEKRAGGVEVELEQDGKIIKKTFDKIISAAGIVPNIEDIGLENTNIELEKGFIKTDRYMATNEPNIYAIGDVTSPPWLAHKASHEGIICAEKIANLDPHVIDKKNIPQCTFSYPQIASIGYTEKEAIAKGMEIKIGRFPFIGNGKAVAMGETVGLIKTIFDAKTGELLGAHMIGAEVTEMIQGFAVAKGMECTELDIMNTIFPHPTMSEAMHESTLSAYNRALHI